MIKRDYFEGKMPGLSLFSKNGLFKPKKLALVAASTFLVLFFCFAIFVAYVSRDLPDPNILLGRDVPQSTKIYDRTGETLLYEIHGDEKRTLIQIQDLPSYVPHATVAIEDKRFYEHHGISWIGLVRAVVVNTVRGERIKGTSTLTQQFVKNAILSNERSLLRKLRELILALQMERTFTKDQILQLYLNEIPYGSNIYGIESAAQSYFGKAAKDLTLDEAAFLAAIPQAPDFYNPYGLGVHGDNREQLVGRQKYIMDQMAEQGYVTREEADAAKQTDTMSKLQPKKVGDIRAPHFVMYVRSLLTEKYGQKPVEQGGLNVITTLDWDKQQIAEAEVKKGVDARGKQYGFTNAALVSVDPKTGEILAMVGSKDFFDEDIDGQVNVTLRPRQPGSSFKPIVYAAGFVRGYLPETQLWDVNTVFRTDGTPYEPKNYDLKEHGPVSIRMALQGSLNIPAVKMLYLVGVGRVLDFAESLGYTTFAQRNRFGLSLVLGGGEVKPLEHAMAYAAFANDGVHVPSNAILSVEDPTGEKLEEWEAPKGEEVVAPQVARLLSNVLSDNDARSFIFGARNFLTLPDRQVAAKTGTTNDYHDAWTAGYTPNLATVVWVGNANNDAMKRGADGSVIAAPIWQAYMRGATKEMPIERFKTPEPPKTNKLAILGRVVQHMVKVDKLTGRRATEFTPAAFIEERPSYEAHSILHYVDKDDPLGPAPSNPANDPQYANWERGVSDWVTRSQWHATDTIPLIYDDAHTTENAPRITIEEPTASAAIMSRTLTIRTTVGAVRTIVQLDAYLNGELIGSSAGNTSAWTIQIPNRFVKGFYTLTISAVDDIGNRGTAQTNINLLAESEGAQAIRIQTPPPGAVWSRATFPKIIQIDLTDPTAFSKIDVSFLGQDGVSRLVDTITNPGESTLRISLSLGPSAGNYQLIVKAERNSGGIEETSVPVTITE